MLSTARVILKQREGLALWDAFSEIWDTASVVCINTFITVFMWWVICFTHRASTCLDCWAVVPPPDC